MTAHAAAGWLSAIPGVYARGVPCESVRWARCAELVKRERPRTLPVPAASRPGLRARQTRDPAPSDLSLRPVPAPEVVHSLSLRPAGQRGKRV